MSHGAEFVWYRNTLRTVSCRTRLHWVERLRVSCAFSTNTHLSAEAVVCWQRCVSRWAILATQLTYGCSTTSVACRSR